jgi:hypothetical protein
LDIKEFYTLLKLVQILGLFLEIFGFLDFFIDFNLRKRKFFLRKNGKYRADRNQWERSGVGQWSFRGCGGFGRGF